MHIVHTRNPIKPPLGCKLVVTKRALLVFLLQVEEVVPVCALQPGFVRIEACCYCCCLAAAACLLLLVCCCCLAAAWLLGCCCLSLAAAWLHQKSGDMSWRSCGGCTLVPRPPPRPVLAADLYIWQAQVFAVHGSAIEGSCIGKGILQNPFDGRGLTICLLEHVS